MSGGAASGAASARRSLGGVVGATAWRRCCCLRRRSCVGSRIVRDGSSPTRKCWSTASDALRDQQYAPILAAHRAALETPFGTSWKGAAKPDVVLVEFFDYACPYCKASNPARRPAAATRIRACAWSIASCRSSGRTASPRARLSLAARKAGRFRQFHDSPVGRRAARARDALPPRQRGRGSGRHRAEPGSRGGTPAATSSSPARSARPARRVRRRRPGDEQRRRLRRAQAGDRRTRRARRGSRIQPFPHGIAAADRHALPAARSCEPVADSRQAEQPAVGDRQAASRTGHGSGRNRPPAATDRAEGRRRRLRTAPSARRGRRILGQRIAAMAIAAIRHQPGRRLHISRDQLPRALAARPRSARPRRHKATQAAIQRQRRRQPRIAMRDIVALEPSLRQRTHLPVRRRAGSTASPRSADSPLRRPPYATRTVTSNHMRLRQARRSSPALEALRDHIPFGRSLAAGRRLGVLDRR